MSVVRGAVEGVLSWRWPLVCTVWCAVMLWSCALWAQEPAGGGEPVAPDAPPRRPKVLLLPTDSVDGKLTSLIPERVDESSRRRLRDDGKVELMPPYTEIRKQLAGQGVASAVIYEAEQLYASGIGLLTAGQNEQAVESFQRAVELMEQNIVDVRSYDILTDALSNLALAYFLTGYDVDSRKRMQQFVHMRPDATLSADKFPPELLTLQAEEQAKIKKAGPGKLVITSQVPGAQIMIDGVERGVTPATLTDVGFGAHYLVVRDPASKGVYSELVRVRGRAQEQVVDAKLSAAGESGGGGDGLPTYYTDLLVKLRTGRYAVGDVHPYLQELSKQSGAPYVAWVTLYKDGARYVAVPLVWRASDGVLSRGEGARFNVELSDLALGVSRLSSQLAVAAVQAPEAGRVTQVDLGPAPVVVAVQQQPSLTGNGGGTDTELDPVVVAPVGGGTDGPKPLRPLDPPAETPSSENRKWKVAGASVAAVVVVGLVAGSVMLLRDPNGEEPPQTNTSFSAEVSW